MSTYVLQHIGIYTVVPPVAYVAPHPVIKLSAASSLVQHVLRTTARLTYRMFTCAHCDFRRLYHSTYQEKCQASSNQSELL